MPASRSDQRSSLDDFARTKLEELEGRGLRRDLVETVRAPDAAARRNGRDLVSFSCNDYLNLSHHPQVIEAAVEATRTYGTGAGASRLITGNHPLFTELEARLARFKQAEACIVFGSGYLANLGIVPALAGPGDLVIADELAHACLRSGAKLSAAEVEIFCHNDLEDLARILHDRRGKFRNCLVVTDGVFSMDGDLAPLPRMAMLCETFDAWLMTDDAHGLGVVGGGRGSSFAFGEEKVRVPLQMGTLSKAIGGSGGYLCASQPVIDLLKSRARTLVYSTGLAPGTAAAAIAALDLIEKKAVPLDKPRENAALFCREAGLPEPESPIVPVIVGDAEKAVEASAMLEAEGFLVTAIRPPTVPQGTARLRIAFSADHKPEDIRRLAGLVRERIILRNAA